VHLLLTAIPLQTHKMTAKLGFIGPCRGDVNALRAPAELLLFELGANRVIYLGADDALDRAIAGWPSKLGAPLDENAFLDEVVLLAPDAPPEVLTDLVARDKKAQRLNDLAALPAPPSRAVEMLDDRVVLMVFDKGVLDEDDVANATAIVWGNAREPQLRAIGPRVFLTPGWIGMGAGPSVGFIEYDGESLRCAVYNGDGSVRLEHRVTLARGAKMGVQGA
jgi:hypothetical protein